MTSERNLLEKLLTNDMDPAAYDPVRMARAAMRPPLPKRFWTEVTVLPVPEGFAVALDGKPTRTPARKMLALPDVAMADAVAEEWRAVGTELDPALMPMTRLANSAIDGVATQIEAVRADAAKYAGSDLLCYRADTPQTLAARQAALWDPLIEWAGEELQARLIVTQGVIFQQQDKDVLEQIAKAVAAVPAPFGLAAFHSITTLTGSVLLALAIAQDG